MSMNKCTSIIFLCVLCVEHEAGLHTFVSFCNLCCTKVKWMILIHEKVKGNWGLLWTENVSLISTPARGLFKMSCEAADVEDRPLIWNNGTQKYNWDGISGAAQNATELKNWGSKRGGVGFCQTSAFWMTEQILRFRFVIIVAMRHVVDSHTHNPCIRFKLHGVMNYSNTAELRKPRLDLWRCELCLPIQDLTRSLHFIPPCSDTRIRLLAGFLRPSPARTPAFTDKCFGILTWDKFHAPSWLSKTKMPTRLEKKRPPRFDAHQGYIY